MKKDSDTETLHDDKYMKTKIKMYNDKIITVVK